MRRLTITILFAEGLAGSIFGQKAGGRTFPDGCRGRDDRRRWVGDTNALTAYAGEDGEARKFCAGGAGGAGFHGCL